MYMNVCCSNYKNRHILNFADDSVIVSLLERETHDHGLVVEQDRFLSASYCYSHFVVINFHKVAKLVLNCAFCAHALWAPLTDGWRFMSGGSKTSILRICWTNFTAKLCCFSLVLRIKILYLLHLHHHHFTDFEFVCLYRFGILLNHVLS